MFSSLYNLKTQDFSSGLLIMLVNNVTKEDFWYRSTSIYKMNGRVTHSILHKHKIVIITLLIGNLAHCVLLEPQDSGANVPMHRQCPFCF